MLSKKAIDDLKAIYKREYGKDLTDDEAHRIGNTVIRAYYIVTRPRKAEPHSSLPQLTRNSARRYLDSGKNTQPLMPKLEHCPRCGSTNTADHVAVCKDCGWSEGALAVTSKGTYLGGERVATHSDLEKLEEKIRSLDENTSRQINDAVYFVIEHFQQKIPPEDIGILRAALKKSQALTDHLSRIEFWVRFLRTVGPEIARFILEQLH
jgi:ribosomal protein L32